MKHSLIMVLCCVAPLAVIAVLWAAGVSGSLLTLSFLLLCPILHFAMMFGMKKKPGDNDKLMHH